MTKKWKGLNGTLTLVAILAVVLFMSLWLMFNRPQTFQREVMVFLSTYVAMALGYHFRWWIEKQPKRQP